MYIPAAFNVNQPEALFDFIEQNSFGLLISQVDDVPFATHLPFLTERKAGSSGELLSHMARANPHWSQAAGQKVLAVFSGPHAYISPTWYEVPNAVPTWNYVAVHVTGVLELITGPSETMNLLMRMVDVYESALPNPWIRRTIFI